MPDILLATKFYIPPIRPDMLPRPHLIERLNAGLGQKGHPARKLTLLSAPAGFGKTTLLSEWVAACARPATWLSLDEGDNDLIRFMAYIIQALQRIQADIGETAQTMLQSPQPPPIESLLAALINEIAAVSSPFVLVLDDYHLVKALPIHEAIAFLLDHLPSCMHLVIAGRSDPFLRLSRLRVQGQITELRSDDLRFSAQDTATFLNQSMGLGLSDEQTAALESRTEGWIAGLHLAALALQGTLSMPGHENPADFIADFTGNDRYVTDYLVDEVLAQQPKQIVDFLLQTSILERMSGPLCDAVTGQQNGQDVLEKLEQANMFVTPLDNKRQWYRYHHLFADLLRHRLRATQPQAIPELYTQASLWHEQKGQTETAIQYALAAQDQERAAHLLDELSPLLLSGNEIYKLLYWIDALPENIRRNFPRLCIFHAFALQFAGRLESIEHILSLAEAHLQNPPISFSVDQITGYAAMTRAYVARRRGDYERAITLSQQALDSFPTDSSNESQVLHSALAINLGIIYSRLGKIAAADETLGRAVALCRIARHPFALGAGTAHLMRLRIIQGRLLQAEALGRRGLEQIAEWQGQPSKKSAHSLATREILVEMGYVLYEKNDIAGAADTISQLVAFDKLINDRSPLTSLVLRVYLNQALGNPGLALSCLQKIEHLVAAMEQLPRSSSILTRLVHMQLLLCPVQPELLVKASRWAKDANIYPGDDFDYRREYEYAALAHVLIAQAKAAEAQPLLKRLCQAAASTARNGDLIRYLIWQALAYQAQGQTDDALASLEQALALAQPEGHVRSFVDQGAPMAKLLRVAAARELAPGYAAALLAAFDDSTRETDRPVEPPGSNLIEPLSERELEILQLLKTELSGPEIARQLFISLNTVRYHSKNIYGKLGVNSRRAAVRQADKLGL